MLGQHIRGGHEFRGGAVPLQTGLDELGELVAGERVQLAALCIRSDACRTRRRIGSPVNHSSASVVEFQIGRQLLAAGELLGLQPVFDGLRHRQTQVDDIDAVVRHAAGRFPEGAGDVVPVDVGVVQDEDLHLADIGARQQFPARGHRDTLCRR